MTVAVRAGRSSKIARKSGSYLMLALLACVVLFPVYMTLVRALSTPVKYINAGSPPYPVAVQWDVFQRAYHAGDLGPEMLRSLVVTLIIVGGQVLTSVLAAYAFVYLRFPFKRLIFALFMATLMLPLEVTLIGNVETMRTLRWFNSFQGLTAPFLATAFGTFLIRQGMLGIPREIRDAARLDGYGHLAYLRRFALPLIRPVLGSFVLIAFLGAWNQYLWPRAITDKQSFDTVQIGIADLLSSRPESANIAVAGALIAAAPIIVLLIFFQRHIVRGLTAGAVKG